MKKSTKIALGAAIVGAVSSAAAYIAADKLFRFGCSRYDDMKDLWTTGKYSGQYSDIMTDAILWARKQHPRRVEIMSRDGLRLVSHIIEAENPRAVIILMHGFHSNGIHDFSLALEFYHKLGFTLIVPDQRAHGESEGKYITYGVKEKEDCALWAKYSAKRYPGLPIILDGLSMGASTVMLATGEDLPPEVCGVIADCGYTTPMAIFRHFILHNFKFEPSLVLPVANRIAKKRAGVDLARCSVPKVLANNKIPLFIAHGEADTFVPPKMSDINIAAAKNCEVTVIKVPGANHGESFLIAKEQYAEMVTEFIDKCIKQYEERVNSTSAENINE